MKDNRFIVLKCSTGWDRLTFGIALMFYNFDDKFSEVSDRLSEKAERNAEMGRLEISNIQSYGVLTHPAKFTTRK